MRTIIIFLFLGLTVSAKSQSIEDFKVDLNKLYNHNFPDSGINQLYENHNKFLNWFPYPGKINVARQYKNYIEFPLADIINDKIYQNSINRLTQDTSTQKRLLASALICATKDTSRIDFITSLVKTNDIKYLWATVHHIHLAPKEIDIILDYLLNNRDFEYGYFYISFFFHLDPLLLEDFAYKNFYNSDPTIQYLAIHSMKYSPLTNRKEVFLKESVEKFDLTLKGWGIALLEYFNVPNVKDVVSPYINLDTLSLNDVSIRALASSSTLDDTDYLYDHLLSKDSLDRTINHLINSKVPITVQNGLKLLICKPIVHDLFINIERHSLLYKKEFLNEIQSLIMEHTDNKIKNTFIPILSEYSDSVTNNILLALLDSKDESFRYYAAEALRNNPSSDIKEKIIQFATNPHNPNLNLIDYLINNNIDTLQDFYLNIYKNDTINRNIKSPFKYLAAFPQIRFKNIFIDILQEKNYEEYTLNRTAAEALGKLGAIETIELIEEHLNKEREGSDSNCIAYINTLANLKTSKSFDIISSFKNSEEMYVKGTVTKILENW